MVALALGGVIGWRSRVSFPPRLDRGLALLALEAVILIAQTLNLSLGGAQVGRKVFDQIQQPGDQVATTVVGDVAEI